MQDIQGKKILLGITGGIAAYKSAYLIRELVSKGAEVRTIMTESAKAFISPLTIQALSGHEVRTSLFDPQAERAMGHIELARWADFLIISPASANMIAKCATGLADDLLSTLFLVFEQLVLICPAMNHSMWSHPATQQNIQKLQDYGCHIVGPDIGEQACQESGFGRLVDIAEIIDAIRLSSLKPCLKGQKVLISAGPTRESLDPVRYLTNHSSGKMGYALAKAAQFAGAEVTLVSGPVQLKKPLGVDVVDVNTASEMFEAVKRYLTPDAIFIGAAAVSDFKPEFSGQKIKKTDEPYYELRLSKNIDIIAQVVKQKLAKFVVGFAAETHDVEAYATQKRRVKKLDMIVANKVGDGVGFHTDDHEVTLMTNLKKIHLNKAHKLILASQIIEFIAQHLTVKKETDDLIIEKHDKCTSRPPHQNG